MSSVGGPTPPGLDKDSGVGGWTAPGPSGPKELNVALFPYVPQRQLFEAAVNLHWRKLHPDIALNFKRYSGYNAYSADPPPTLDVFAFDAVFASYFRERGYLRPLSISDHEDIFPWALAGLGAGGGRFWAVPYLGCMDVMIYRREDTRLSAPDMTVEELRSILGDSPDEEPCPPKGEGLLIGLTSGTTASLMYFEVVMENNRQYPLDPPLPRCPHGLDPNAMRDLHTVVRIAGRKQASAPDKTGYDRLAWFLEGFGRGLVGYPEVFHWIDPKVAGDYTFRPFPMASQPITTLPLYTDVIGVNRAVTPDKVDLATELANLIASAAVVSYAIWGIFPPGNPQYLTPVRRSLLKGLAERWPIYQSIRRLLTATPTTAFRVGAASRPWLNAYKECIRDQILGPGLQFDESHFVAGYEQTPGGLSQKP
jgi:thiamine pyridinylase